MWSFHAAINTKLASEDDETCPDPYLFFLFVKVFISLSILYNLYRLLKKCSENTHPSPEELKKNIKNIPTHRLEKIYIKKWNHFGEKNCEKCKTLLNIMLLEHCSRIDSRSPHSSNFIKIANYLLPEHELAYQKDRKKNQFIVTIYPAMYLLLIKQPKELIKFKEKFANLHLNDHIAFYDFLIYSKNKYKLDSDTFQNIQNARRALTTPGIVKKTTSISSHQFVSEYVGIGTSEKTSSIDAHKEKTSNKNNTPEATSKIASGETTKDKNSLNALPPPILPIVKHRRSKHRRASSTISQKNTAAAVIPLEIKETHYQISNNFILDTIDAARRLEAFKKKQREKEQARLQELKEIENKQNETNHAFKQLEEEKLDSEKKLNDLAKQNDAASQELKKLADQKILAERAEEAKRRISAPEKIAKFALKVALELDSSEVKETKTHSNPFEKHLLVNKRSELITALITAFKQESSFGPIEEKELEKILAKLNKLPSSFVFPVIDSVHNIADAMKRLHAADIEIVFGVGGLLRDYLLELDLGQLKREEEKKEVEYDVDLIISADFTHEELFKVLCGAFPKVHNLFVKATSIGENLYVYTIFDTLNDKKLYQIVNSPYFDLAKKTAYKNAPLLFDAKHKDQVLNASYYDHNQQIYTPLASTLIAIVCRFIHLIKNDMRCFLRALISYVTLNTKSSTEGFLFSDAFENSIPQKVNEISLQTQSLSLSKEQQKEFVLVNTLLSTKVFCLPFETTFQIFELFTELGITEVLFPRLIKISKEKIKSILQKTPCIEEIYLEFLMAGSFSDFVSLCHSYVFQNKTFFNNLKQLIRSQGILYYLCFDSNPNLLGILLNKLQNNYVRLPIPHSSNLHAVSHTTFYGSSSTSSSSSTMIPYSSPAYSI